MNSYLDTVFKSLSLALAGLLMVSLMGAGCTKGKKGKIERKPGDKTVLSQRSGDTLIQVTESDQDGTPIVRVTTTYKGEENHIVLVIDQPTYEVEIPLSVENMRPRRNRGGGGDGNRKPGGGASGRDFEDILIVQYLEKAQSAMIAGRYNEALRQVNLVEMVRPDNIRAHTMKGSVYYAMGNYDLAHSEWERVLQLDPSNTEVRDFMEFLKNAKGGAPKPPLPRSMQSGSGRR